MAMFPDRLSRSTPAVGDAALAAARCRCGDDPHDFVNACINRIAGEFSEEASEAPTALAGDKQLTSYRDDILHATETRSRLMREKAFKHSPPAAVEIGRAHV